MFPDKRCDYRIVIGKPIRCPGVDDLGIGTAKFEKGTYQNVIDALPVADPFFGR